MVSIIKSLKRTAQAEGYSCNDNTPNPIVNLNRWTIITSILAGLALQWPLVTTALFLILLAAVTFGQRGSLIFRTGKRLMALGVLRSTDEEGEDRRLMRFNNSIAVTLLGLAQVAFLFGLPVVGWAFTLLLVVAATAALMGICLGCVLFYRFRVYRYRLFGAR